MQYTRERKRTRCECELLGHIAPSVGRDGALVKRELNCYKGASEWFRVGFVRVYNWMDVTNLGVRYEKPVYDSLVWKMMDIVDDSPNMEDGRKA